MKPVIVESWVEPESSARGNTNIIIAGSASEAILTIDTGSIVVAANPASADDGPGEVRLDDEAAEAADAVVAVGGGSVIDAAKAMRLLAEAGVVSGESGAAGLAGLLEIVASADTGEARELLGLGPSTTVLVFSTEGATDPGAYREIVGRDAAEVAAQDPPQNPDLSTRRTMGR